MTQSETRNGVTPEEACQNEADIEEKAESTVKKAKKSKKKKKKVNYESYFNAVLERTASSLDGVTDEQKLEMPSEFAGYQFTGSLRPCYVSKQVSVPDHIPKPDYWQTGEPKAEMEHKRGQRPTIHVYSEEEIEIMRKLCKLGREVLDIGGKFLKAGVTGDEIDRIVHQAAIDRGCYPSPLNYRNFPKSLCVSVNEVVCHGIPDCRPLQDGDIVNLDISLYKDGYHTDLNETFFIGECDEDSQTLVRTAYESLQQACASIQPGMLYRDVGQIISKVAHQNNCSVVKTYCGHGVGIHFHCAPDVPHYARNKAVGIMRPGHIFTIEPMINFGGSWGDQLWPDNWTSVTLNGNRSAQFEHTFLVTETGVEILTARKGAPKDRMIWDQEALQR